jgi:hypothetical protein
MSGDKIIPFLPLSWGGGYCITNIGRKYETVATRNLGSLINICGPSMIYGPSIIFI